MELVSPVYKNFREILKPQLDIESMILLNKMGIFFSGRYEVYENTLDISFELFVYGT